MRYFISSFLCVLAFHGIAQLSPDGIFVYDGYENPKGCFVFAPEDAAQRDTLGLVVMLHGYGALNPLNYGQWVRRIVEHGNVVIYPRYQRNLLIPSTKKFVGNAIKGIQKGLTFVKTQAEWRVDLSRVCYFGHSYGGVITSHLLAKQDSIGLPQAFGALLAAPGTSRFRGGRLATYELIPGDVQLLTVTHAGDYVTGSEFAELLQQTVPTSMRFAWIKQTADSLGAEYVNHGHNEVYAVDMAFDTGLRNYTTKKALRVGKVDAIDTDLYWPLTDELLTAYQAKGELSIFTNRSETYTFGVWADGSPRIPLPVYYPIDQNALATQPPAGQ